MTTWPVFDEEDGSQKTIVVLSRSKAKEWSSGIPWAGIQIATYDGDWPKLNKVQRYGLLQLVFDDADLPRDNANLFDEEHAKQILEFIDAVWHKIKILLVHCEAGVSRSPGVAAAIAKAKYNDDSFYFKHFMPNRLVYRRLLEVLMDR